MKKTISIIGLCGALGLVCYQPVSAQNQLAPDNAKHSSKTQLIDGTHTKAIERMTPLELFRQMTDEYLNDEQLPLEFIRRWADGRKSKFGSVNTATVNPNPAYFINVVLDFPHVGIPTSGGSLNFFFKKKIDHYLTRKDLETMFGEYKKPPDYENRYNLFFRYSRPDLKFRARIFAEFDTETPSERDEVNAIVVIRERDE